jgi:hypothetical protein
MQIRTYVYYTFNKPSSSYVSNPRSILAFTEDLSSSVEYFTSAVKFDPEISSVLICVINGAQEYEISIETIRDRVSVNEVEVTATKPEED